MERNDFWAKIKRTIGAFFPVSSARRGACKNCGAYCYLMFNGCLFLNKAENGKQYCGAYPFRPLNCRKYPRIEKEWVPVKTCGFYFDRSTCEPDPTTSWSPENS